jgi:hypothetical protein
MDERYYVNQSNERGIQDRPHALPQAEQTPPKAPLGLHEEERGTLNNAGAIVDRIRHRRRCS